MSDDEPLDYDAELADAAAPTELAGIAEAETNSSYAWGLCDEAAVARPRRLTPGQITAAAVAVSIAVITAATVFVMHQIRDATTAAPVVVTVSATPSTADPPAVVSARTLTPETVTVTQPPPVTRTVAAAPIQTKAPAASPSMLQGPLPDLMPFNGRFLAAVEQGGWAIWDRGLMVQRGHETCWMLREGDSGDTIARKLMGVEPQLTPQMAYQFIGIVSASYPNCP